MRRPPSSLCSFAYKGGHELLTLLGSLSHATIEELKLRLKKANDKLKNNVMQLLKTLTNQLTMAITSEPLAQPLMLAFEAGNYGTNIWCCNCNKHGHSNQFCIEPLFFNHNEAILKVKPRTTTKDFVPRVIRSMLD